MAALAAAQAGGEVAKKLPGWAIAVIIIVVLALIGVGLYFLFSFVNGVSTSFTQSSKSMGSDSSKSPGSDSSHSSGGNGGLAVNNAAILAADADNEDQFTSTSGSAQVTSRRTPDAFIA